MKTTTYLLGLTLLTAAAQLPARPARSTGPDSVESLLDDRRQEREALIHQDLGKRLDEAFAQFSQKSGLTLGADYSALYYLADSSPVGASDEAASGMVRLYGSWKLIDRDGPTSGTLNFKVEHRHGFTEPAPSGFSLNLGNVGVMGGPFNDNGWRLTNLYWRQGLGERAAAYVGFLDATDFVDTYGLASPWSGFGNLAFSTGSSSMALPNDAGFGAMLGAWLSDEVYAIGGITALNSDPTDPFQSAEDFFDENEYFKSLEIGWTKSKDRFYADNVHVTFWHVDSIGATGTPDGWGVNFSAAFWIDDVYMPFLRGGYADDGGSLLETSISAGIATELFDDRDLVGLAANWGRPNESTFGPDLDDQVSVEMFYRLQVSEKLRVSPSVQWLVNPALNPDQDHAVVFGLRGVLSF